MRIGLVGAGRWGKRYIATFQTLPDLSLARVASRNPLTRLLVPEGCDVTPFWEEVTSGHRLDGVIITTPPHLHGTMAKAAIHASLPVLVEKPFTLSLGEAGEVAAMARQEGVLVMVGHTHLFSSAYHTLKARASALGRLMEIRSVGSSWGPFRPDTPVLWDYGPHDVAMCVDLVAGFPIEIEATCVRREVREAGAGEEIKIVLRFANHVRAEIMVSNVNPVKERRFEAHYDGGTLIYDDLAEDKLVLQDRSGQEQRRMPIDASRPLTNLIREFSGSIAAGEKEHSSLKLALQVVDILEKCQASLGADRRE